MRLTAGLLCCLLLFTCRPQKSFSSRNHGCLFDLRLCSKEEVCVQDGLFGQCRERTERDVGQIQVTPGTLQHLQDVLRQLTAKGMSWRDDMTQRIMAHKMGHLPQHRPIEPLDVLDEERYPPVFRTPGRTVPRLSGAVQPSTQRWVGSNDQLQYFRPRLSSSASSEVPTVQQQRLSGSIKKNTSPLVDRYLTYILLNSQSPSSQRSNTQANLPPLHSYTKFTYQDKSHVRNPSRLFGASNSWPEGSSRISFGRYQGGQEMPLPIHLPSERHQAWADLRRKLPRESVDSDLPEDVLDSSEMIERLSQLSDGDQDPQPDSRSEPPRTLRGAAGIQMKPVPQTELETQDIDDVQSLVGALERYGLDLRQLSEPQLEQLSAVLQLIQSDAVLNQGTRNPDRSPSKRITEGEMQHMAVAEPQFPPPEMSPSSFPTATNAELDKTGSVRSTSATINMLPKPDTQTRGEEPDNLRGPINEDQEQRLLDKKSYPEGGLMIDVPQATEEYGYIMTNQTPLSLLNGARLLETLAERVHLSTASFINNSVVGSSLTFQIKHNHQNLSLMDVANRAGALKSDLETSTGVKIIQTGVAQKDFIPPRKDWSAVCVMQNPDTPTYCTVMG